MIRLATYAPNLREAIVDWSLFTPWDLEQRVGLTDGNIRHLDIVPSQFLTQRPLPGYADYRTPIPGLYLCGAGTPPGGEVTGAPGHNAAAGGAARLGRVSGGVVAPLWSPRSAGGRRSEMTVCYNGGARRDAPGLLVQPRGATISQYGIPRMTTAALDRARAAVIGTGAWGLTLAMILARNGVPTTLWARTADEAAALRTTRHHPTRPHRRAAPRRAARDERPRGGGGAGGGRARRGAFQTMRANAERLAPHLSREAIVVSASKGIEIETSQRMTEVLAAALPLIPVERIGTLSGPNLAREIAAGLPATTVVAAPEEAVAVRVQRLLMSATFRVYTHTDVIGVELAGC